jgi:hypothetical protein
LNRENGRSGGFGVEAPQPPGNVTITGDVEGSSKETVTQLPAPEPPSVGLGQPFTITPGEAHTRAVYEPGGAQAGLTQIAPLTSPPT